MSSKAVGQQQQGRRTPLSLSAGKSHHQNQQQQNPSNSNKNNHNSNNNAVKNHELKEAMSKNNNQSAKHQHESKNLANMQKETKKAHQNGSKHVIANNDDDEVMIIEQNGTANGNNGNNISTRNNGSTTKPNNSASSKDSKEKEKDKSESEIVQEKSEQKSKKGDTSKVTEKKQNDAIEKEATADASAANSNKSQDGTSTPAPNITENDKQNEQVSTPGKPSTPTKAQKKSTTPLKPEKTEKLTCIQGKTNTASKSPKSSSVAKSEISGKSEEVIEINENEIEPLVVESSPPKKSVPKHVIAPTATSTPGKMETDGKRSSGNAKSEIQLTMETRRSVDRKSVPRSFSDISGRRSIRSCTDYTPNMYNSQFRESYRRINTELDVTGITNTSMNVTVGSEIPNNSSFLSFSFFGRGRKRERTPPHTVPEKSQSAVELTTETTPPKRARLDVHGIFSVVSSPLTMLRTRFSKTTLETPTKNENLASTTNDVQNVSGISIEEVISSTELTATEDITVGKEAVGEKTPSKLTPSKDNSGDAEKLQSDEDIKDMAMEVDGIIKITETPVVAAVGEPKSKQRGCLLM